MKAGEYKAYKGLRKESLRDNMTDIEIALTNIGEIATRDIAKEEHPKGLNENIVLLNVVAMLQKVLGIYMKKKPRNQLFQVKIY